MPAFTPPPAAPQRGDRATFSQRVDAFLTWLVSLVAQLNIFVANLNERDLGGASTFVYNFDSNTADSDPGSGKIRFNNATQNQANQIRIDDETVSRMNLVGFFDSLQSVTSNTKGSMRMQKLNDPSKWIFLDIFGAPAGTGGGYRNLQVMVRTASGPNPFVNGDDIAIFIDRNGDKGDGGNTPTQQQMRDAIGILPVVNGGTGSNSAAQALANLNGASQAGANMAGAMSFNNFIPISFKDSIGVASPTIFMDDGNNLSIVNSGGGLIKFPNKARNADLMTIDNAGNVRQMGRHTQRAIGANGTTRVLFEMQQSDAAVRYQLGLGTNESLGLYTYSTAGGYNGAIEFASGGFVASGNCSAVRFTGTSDETLKENWRAVPDDFLERFAAIERAGLFDWSETGETDGGIGAQSVREIAPWCVFEVNGKLRVNHAALNTVVSHALTRRVLRNEAMQ